MNVCFKICVRDFLVADRRPLTVDGKGISSKLFSVDLKVPQKRQDTVNLCDIL